MLIVAELSANHLGSLKRALEIVDAAADAGADLFKIQTWTKDTMCLDREYTLTHGPWAGKKLFDLYREAWTPWEWHKPIFDRARRRGMIPFSAAFDRESVDFLEKLGVDRHKIASFELTDLPLIRYMASKGKPIILSTGMATWNDIVTAVDTTLGYLPKDVDFTLLKCTSAYPSDASDSNLATMVKMRDSLVSLGTPDVGISDHTPGIGVAVAAAALGATMIEKHLTLSRSDGGPDAGFSMEPAEFKQMITECRRAAAAIGQVKYGPSQGEDTSLRRSLWTTMDIKAGDRLVLGVNVATARPALGLSPDTDLSDKVAKCDIEAYKPLTQDML